MRSLRLIGSRHLDKAEPTGAAGELKERTWPTEGFLYQRSQGRAHKTFLYIGDHARRLDRAVNGEKLLELCIGGRIRQPPDIDLLLSQGRLHNLGQAISYIDATANLAVVLIDLDMPGWRTIVRHTLKTITGLVIAMEGNHYVEKTN